VVYTGQHIIELLTATFMIENLGDRYWGYIKTMSQFESDSFSGSIMNPSVTADHGV
jgi:hypothetical protein